MKSLFAFIIILFISCKHDNNHSNKIADKKTKKSIVIFQPLKKFSQEQLIFLKDSIEKFYPVNIILNRENNFPTSAWYAPRSRYRADSTIVWLKTLKPDSVRLILGLTDKDISTSKGEITDYGVMGLGFKPGTSCIISSFRLRKNIHSAEELNKRLFKVVAHEMGHNFGLPHCPNPHCIMKDAEGKMVLDDEQGLCNNCKGKLTF
jgi:archaemetzincin